MVTDVEDVTEPVVTVKFAPMLPPGTVTVVGTDAAELSLLERATFTPQGGAVADRLTVP